VTAKKRPALAIELPLDLPELGTPAQVAKYLHTNVDSLAQMRYRGNVV
jgi:hypothetical protein